MSHHRRLAITISGAVSLGSYEAGVLYEILCALERNNTNPQLPDEDKVFIDVLAGASAGGMTATIAAQVLLDPRGRLNSHLDNAFYNPWVNEIDLDGLLSETVETGYPPELSILTSAEVDRIANRHLHSNIDAQPPDAHPAAADSIWLGLSLSNLNGVDYDRTTIGAKGVHEAFIYTRFQDELMRQVRADGNATQTDWATLRQAALACGAFPFAFRARDVAREARDFTDRDGLRAGQFPDGKRTYTYVDGGTFHNEPLGLARNLVVEANGDHPEDEDRRFYLFVSPDTKVSKRPEFKSSTPEAKITAATETMPKAVGHLVNAIFAQARFQDWIMAEKVNHHVHALDEMARTLADALFSPPAAEAGAVPLPQALALVADAFLPKFYDPATTQADLQTDLTRLAHAYVDFPASNGRDCLTELPPQDRDVWLKAVLLLEKTAGLEDKSKMTILTITASSDELSGDPLAAFAGFFSFKARHHDYEVGRKKAREWIKSNCGPDGVLPLRGHDQFQSPEPDIDPTMNKWSMSDFDRDKRKAFASRVAQRVEKVANLPWWIAWLGRIIVRRAMRKFLQL